MSRTRAPRHTQAGFKKHVAKFRAIPHSFVLSRESTGVGDAERKKSLSSPLHREQRDGEGRG